jgi:hypothetical protein
VYQVKYVQVYSATPDVVYVGYTPGYVGCYAFNGAVVFGTGYYYPAWHGAYYYPRPATWGFSAHYNSFTGNWGFNVAAAGPRGWVDFGYYHGKYISGGWIAGGGWWGHGGFVNFHPNVVYSGNRLAVNNQFNIYNRQNNIGRNVVSPNRIDRPGGVPGEGIRRPTGEPVGPRTAGQGGAGTRLNNDIFADRNGNVLRRTPEGWQQRTSNGWSKPESPLERREQMPEPRRISDSGWQHPAPPARPSYEAARHTPDRFDLDQHSWARDRGEYRANNFQHYQSARAAPSGSFRGGGFRGGGRR